MRLFGLFSGQVLLILVLCFSAFSTKAQDTYHTYETTDKKAKEDFDKYLDFTNKRMSKECEAVLLKTIERDPLFYEAHAALGDIELELKKYRACVTAEQQALALSATFNSKPYYVLGKAYFKLESYDSAEQYFTLYLDQPKIDTRTKNEAIRGQKNATFAKEAIKHPVPFNPERLSDSVNLPGMSYFPVLSLDEKTLIFTHRRLLDNGKCGDEDFYASHLKDNGEWSKAEPLVGVNTEENEGAETISSDGREIYFTRCINSFESDRSCDIYYSYKKNATEWSTPVNIQAPINTKAWESQPSLSPDGNTLYFSSNRPGGKGTYDVWLSNWDFKMHYWSNPVNAGDTINTPYAEYSPFIAADNKTLYFASDGHPGMGGKDIFYARKKPDGTWSEPVNIGYPINTAGDESALFIARDGHSAYFASDREGTLAIYRFELYEAARPTMSTYVEGFITDGNTKAPIETLVYLLDIKTHDTVMQTLSSSSDGHYIMSLPTGHAYALEINKPGFLFYSEHFSLSGSTDETFRKDAALQPFAAGKKTVLKNIFFNVDKFDVLPESYTELDIAVNMLRTNSTMKIEIGGHTDNTGDAGHNQKLSQDRASSVLNYLVDHGISRNRLTSKGYGATQPIDTNDTPEGRANNRRTEFTILEL